MTRPLVWIPAAMEALIEHGPKELEITATPADPEHSDRFGDVEVLVTPLKRANFDQLYGAMKSLKVIQTSSAGIREVIPCVPPGVLLCSSRGSYGVVAEWVVAAVLSDMKSFPKFRDSQSAAKWDKRSVQRLLGKTVLFVGYGGIAEDVERCLQLFGAKFLRVARTARPGVSGVEDLSELVPQADVVIILVPHTDETIGLADKQFLASMKEGALLINAARGSVVDTDALMEITRAGKITAVLDVTDPEPLPDGHPLYSIPNVFITPHVAGSGLAAPEVMEFVRTQLVRFARGEPLANVVVAGY